ncbi:MAG: PIN domain-containing protein [Gammaproteobacteria bacterium]|nr:PIN domain-containing protein [Gammaproteobacteria bacterium]
MTMFLDTNVLVYAQGKDAKGERARELVIEGGVISVQVLNEFTNVMNRKFRVSWNEIVEALQDVKSAVDNVLPIDMATHTKAVQLAGEHGFNFYDALIISSALQAGCTQLLSEDLQAGRRINGLTIVNPFLR